MIKTKNVLSGTLTNKNALNGGLTTPRVITLGTDIYEGDCTVIPCIEGSTIECKNKVMVDDIVIEPIPYFEVGNDKNGTTIIIGGNE